MKVMEAPGIADPEGTYARWVRYVNEYEEGATLLTRYLPSFPPVASRRPWSRPKRERSMRSTLSPKASTAIWRRRCLQRTPTGHKPDPTPLLICLERLGVEPSEAIYIGDARSDYEAARNAHMAFGHATWGSTSSEGIEEPDVVLDAPKDILQAVL